MSERVKYTVLVDGDISCNDPCLTENGEMPYAMAMGNGEKVCIRKGSPTTDGRVKNARIEIALCRRCRLAEISKK